jgi:hypothetical protein
VAGSSSTTILMKNCTRYWSRLPANERTLARDGQPCGAWRL